MREADKITGCILGFQRLLEEIIGAGGDTDTNAAIAGQISGTVIGQAGLPRELIVSYLI